MITATEHGLGTPQRVRQFFVQQQLEDYLPSPDAMAREEEPEGEGEGESQEEDLPTFLKNRSLRRRLDDAFDSCYQSNMGEWIRAIFRRS